MEQFKIGDRVRVVNPHYLKNNKLKGSQEVPSGN